MLKVGVISICISNPQQIRNISYVSRFAIDGNGGSLNMPLPISKNLGLSKSVLNNASYDTHTLIKTCTTSTL